MRLILTTTLPIAADYIWALELRLDTLAATSEPPITVYCNAKGRSDWREGEVYHFHNKLFDRFSLGAHEVEVTLRDDNSFVLVSEESGGVITSWRHQVNIRDLGQGRCQHQGRIDFEAGVWTLPLWLAAALFYRLRMWRLKKLALAGLRNAKR